MKTRRRLNQGATVSVTWTADGRVAAAMDFCRYVGHARECMAAAHGEVSPCAVGFRALARSWARMARVQYGIAMGKGGSV